VQLIVFSRQNIFYRSPMTQRECEKEGFYPYLPRGFRFLGFSIPVLRHPLQQASSSIIGASSASASRVRLCKGYSRKPNPYGLVLPVNKFSYLRITYMLAEIPKPLYLLVPLGVFVLIYLGKVDIDIEFLGNIVKIISK
jgi:hypothetical protein